LNLPEDSSCRVDGLFLRKADLELAVCLPV
jgi:hypothetical protein